MERWVQTLELASFVAGFGLGPVFQLASRLAPFAFARESHAPLRSATITLSSDASSRALSTYRDVPREGRTLEAPTLRNAVIVAGAAELVEKSAGTWLLRPASGSRGNAFPPVVLRARVDGARLVIRAWQVPRVTWVHWLVGAFALSADLTVLSTGARTLPLLGAFCALVGTSVFALQWRASARRRDVAIDGAIDTLTREMASHASPPSPPS